MARFIKNINNVGLWISGESWRIPYSYDEVSSAYQSWLSEAEALKKGSNKVKESIFSSASKILNKGKQKEKPLFSEIREGFFRFKKLSNTSSIWGTYLESDKVTQKNYDQLVFLYQASREAKTLCENLSQGDILEFYPVGEMCQGGYRIQAERQVQTIHNSRGSFIIPLKQVDQKAEITALFPTPFDREEESFSYLLFNNQFDLISQKQGQLKTYQKAKVECIRFFFLVSLGDPSQEELATIMSFEGYLTNNEISSEVSSQAVVSFDAPVSVETPFILLNHDYYESELLS